MASADPVTLSGALTEQYKVISEYMAANKLVFNADKTRLLVLGTKSMAEKRNMVTMQADNHTILPSKQEKLLGCFFFLFFISTTATINHYFKWLGMVISNPNLVDKQTNKQLHRRNSTESNINTSCVVNKQTDCCCCC